jgi:GT2 family glycosyltransferase
LSGRIPVSEAGTFAHFESLSQVDNTFLRAKQGPEISVITVAYNSAGCIEECLNSVLQQEGVRTEAIVVDNHSSDNTTETVQTIGPAVRLIANTENVGFGRACNQGFENSRGLFVFFLNPDACLEERDGLASLCRVMEKRPRWGLAGTQIIRPDGRMESPGETKYPDQDRLCRDFRGLPGELAWVVGASMIVRRQAFAAVEGFDPGFFLYSEETDLCLRLRQSGWEIGFTPEVTVRHIGEVSERGNDPYDSWLRRMTGLHRFWSKHYSPQRVRRLVRKDWFRSNFRQRWYGLMVRLCGTSSSAWLKHRRYAAIGEASRRFLKAMPNHSTAGLVLPNEKQEFR